MDKRKVKLIFSNGCEFMGYSCSRESEKVFPAVFFSDMTGYEDMIFDPRFYAKLVVMSYPLIGSCGVSRWHMSKRAFLGALAARELTDETDPARDCEKITEALYSADVAAIDGLDTRKIVKMLRDEGALTATFANENENFRGVIHRFENFCEEPRPIMDCAEKGVRKYTLAGSAINIAAIDCSHDHDIAKTLWNMGASVTVFGPDVKAEEISKSSFDALIITDGPGSGAELADTVSRIPAMPTFAVGTGALTAFKSAFEEAKLLRRVNFCPGRPIQDVRSLEVFTASKFCEYDADEASLAAAGFSVSLRDTLDGSVAGFESADGALTAVLAVPPAKKLFEMLQDFIEKLNGEKKDA